MGGELRVNGELGVQLVPTKEWIADGQGTVLIMRRCFAKSGRRALHTLIIQFEPRVVKTWPRVSDVSVLSN